MPICNGSPLASKEAGFDGGGGGGGGKGGKAFRSSTPESSLILLVILDFLDSSIEVIISAIVSGLTLAFDSRDWVT